MQGRLLLDVVVTEGATIFQLLASKDQTLLVRWNALLVLFNTQHSKLEEQYMLICLQCLDAVGWVSERASGP